MSFVEKNISGTGSNENLLALMNWETADNTRTDFRRGVPGFGGGCWLKKPIMTQ